jgi:hypothetical protein
MWFCVLIVAMCVFCHVVFPTQAKQTENVFLKIKKPESPTIQGAPGDADARGRASVAA